MADVTTSKNVLQMVASFADGDDRTFTVDNPKASISAAEVNSLSAYMKDYNIILGDKNAADFGRIKSAKIINSTTTYYDVSN